MNTKLKQIQKQWARIGVGLNVRAAKSTPDLECLILDTARSVSESPLLFTLVISWIGRYGKFIAHHRLRHLVACELEKEAQPALGLLLAYGVELGGPDELLNSADLCKKADEPGPLYAFERENETFARIAKHHASKTALRWNLWVEPAEPKFDALRNAEWIWKNNPALHDRIVRKGDLRATVLEVLRHDLPDGYAPSEAELARHCGATRAAVRKALDALEQEGYRLRTLEKPNRRDQPIHLQEAA